MHLVCATLLCTFCGPRFLQIGAGGSKIVVISIADPNEAFSLQQEISTSGATNVDKSRHVAMSPDDSTVRVPEHNIFSNTSTVRRALG